MGDKFSVTKMLDPLSLFTKDKTPAAAAPPPLVAPTVMPDKDDAAVLAAKKRKTAEVAGRSGRASTILSDETLGG